MEGTAYVLCAVTALACGILLLRGYWRSRTRLLLWTGLFFLAMVAENVALFVDLVVFPEVDVGLLTVRRVIGLAAVAVLVYGLIWEHR